MERSDKHKNERSSTCQSAATCYGLDAPHTNFESRILYLTDQIKAGIKITRGHPDLYVNTRIHATTAGKAKYLYTSHPLLIGT